MLLTTITLITATFITATPITALAAPPAASIPPMISLSPANSSFSQHAGSRASEQTRSKVPGSRLAEQLRVYAGERRPLPLERGARITLSTKDADLVEVLRAFARLAGVNLVLDPSVRGKVTVELFDVPWEDALKVILATHGLGAELDGRVWRVGT